VLGDAIARMSASLACMAATLSRANRLERVGRWLFVGGLVASLAAPAWFLLRNGHGPAEDRPTS
jgi:hypothetical protein